jgi:hypothetical protein
VKPRTIEQLVLVATTYRAAVAAGQPPLPAVAERLNISHRAAADRVYRARSAGLLEATSKGRATRHHETRG